MNDIAKIKSMVHDDDLTGHRIEVRVSPQFSTIHRDESVYYFVRETGAFDGTSALMGDGD